MLKDVKSKLLSSNPETTPKAFVRLGWIGFWSQIVLGAFPILLMFYVLFFCPSAPMQRTAMSLTEYLGLLGFLLLLFTIFWCYRYTRLGKSMADLELHPSEPSVSRTLRIGLVASSLGILFSMLLMISEVARLLFVFLRAPQGGAPVVQTQTYDPSTWVSAIDMVGLLADLSLLAAELMVLAFTLRLLFRTTLSTR
jgi:hypothetical protein